MPDNSGEATHCSGSQVPEWIRGQELREVEAKDDASDIDDILSTRCTDMKEGEVLVVKTSVRPAGLEKTDLLDCQIWIVEETPGVFKTYVG